MLSPTRGRLKVLSRQNVEPNKGAAEGSEPPKCWGSAEIRDGVRCFTLTHQVSRCPTELTSGTDSSRSPSPSHPLMSAIVLLPEGPSSSDERRCITALTMEDDHSNCVSPSWCRVPSTSKPAAAEEGAYDSTFKAALVDNAETDSETDGHTSPRSVSYVDLTAVDSTPPPPPSALEVTLRLLPSIVPAGWALLIAIWAGLAVAVRAEAFGAPTFLAVAFSGWTAVVATALGGLPLLLARPDRVPAKMVGVANAAAAGMMVGAGLGMFGGLVEELPVTGAMAPAAGIATGAVIVAAVGRLGATAGNSNRVAMVVVAFAADAFAEGLALAAASVAGSSVNLLVTAALIIHNLPEGLAVAAALALKPNSRISPGAACLLASLTSLPQPLVGLGCCWLLRAEMHPLVPCLLTAASVGAVLWVAMADLFVESAASLGGLSAMAIVAPTAALMLVHHALTED